MKAISGWGGGGEGYYILLEALQVRIQKRLLKPALPTQTEYMGKQSIAVG
jgi:hypothetical protein